MTFRPLDLHLSVVPGMRARTVHVTTETELVPPAERIARLALAPEIVGDFVEGFRVGCFTARAEQASLVVSRAHDAEGRRVETFELALPKASTAPFDVLVRSARQASLADRRLRLFEVIELAPPELPRISRDALDAHEPPPSPPFGFELEIEDDEAKDFRIEVTFAESVSDATVAAARRLFLAWGALLWGFPWRGDESGWGFVTEVTKHVSNTVIACGEGFMGGEESWSALLRGLVVLHASHAIAQVDIY